MGADPVIARAAPHYDEEPIISGTRGSGAIFFSGCTAAENSKDWPVTVGGATIDKEPQNIVVLNDCFADIISYIGYDIKMVGRSDECDQEFLHVVPSVGKAATPDINAITTPETDLVIADGTLSADAKASIEEGGAKVVTLEVPTTEDALKQLYVDLGTALGGKETGSAKGEDGYTELLDMLSTMNTATSNIVCTVAYLYLDGSGQLCTFVKDTLEYKFFNYNGNTNIVDNQTEPVVNPDELHIGSPNYIFYDSEEVLALLKSDERYANIHALQHNGTLLIPRKAFNRYGTSAEQAIFDILSFIEKDSKGTPDEATPDAAAAPAAQPAATEAPAASVPQADAADTAQDEEVISYSVQDSAE